MPKAPAKSKSTATATAVSPMSVPATPTAPDAEARQRIVTAARRHFLAHGFRGVTMDDLAGELGMSKKTLYAHFEGKTALLSAVLQDKLRSADADLTAALEETGADFAKALPRMLATVRRHTEELQPSFQRDMAREAPEMFQLVQGRRREMIQKHFGRLIGAGCKTGMIRSDVPVELMIEILTGMTDSIVNPVKLAELQLQPRDAFAAVITIFLDGIKTEKGKKSL